MNTGVITAADVPGDESRRIARARAMSAMVENKVRVVRRLIWLYILLWLIEGGLRRWFLPGLASPLLLVRDPLVIAIYWIASSNGLFPMNGFISWGAFLAVLSIINAMVLGHGHLFVAIYGARCDFLHVPLIFIMGRVLRQKDLAALGKWALLVAIPFTLLLVAQFNQPQDAWVNRGVGGNMDGAGFDGAEGHYRPPGTFSFITGPSLLYPMITAFWFALLLSRKVPLWLLAGSGLAIVISIPISISRTLALNVAIVVIAGIAASVVGGRFSFKLLLQLGVVSVVVYFMVGQIKVFKEGMIAFNSRWEMATTEQGGFQTAIVDRMLEDLIGNLNGVKSYGAGTGFSTNVGQKSITSELGFGGSEGEWGRLIYDNGYALGSMMILYRVALALYVLFAALKAWKRRSPIALIFAATCFQMLVHGHWGQTTTLGAVIIGAGVTLAAAWHPELEPGQRMRRQRA